MSKKAKEPAPTIDEAFKMHIAYVIASASLGVDQNAPVPDQLRKEIDALWRSIYEDMKQVWR